MYFIDYFWCLNDKMNMFDKEFQTYYLFIKEVCPTIYFKLNLLHYENNITSCIIAIDCDMHHEFMFFRRI